MEPPEALFELLLRNMLVVTEDNYVNCFEPNLNPVISIGRVTICTYQRIKLMCKLLKCVFISIYLAIYLLSSGQPLLRGKVIK
jgi:hypothetical protein